MQVTMSFFTPSIRSRVIAAVEKKIEQVELLYREELDDLERKHDAEKGDLLDKHIDSILTKVL